MELRHKFLGRLKRLDESELLEFLEYLYEHSVFEGKIEKYNYLKDVLLNTEEVKKSDQNYEKFLDDVYLTLRKYQIEKEYNLMGLDFNSKIRITESIILPQQL